MRVRICKSIDIDEEVLVDVNDVFAEMWDRLEVGDDGGREQFGVLSTTIGILARVPDAVLTALPISARDIAVSKLRDVLARLEIKKPESAQAE